MHSFFSGIILTCFCFSFLVFSFSQDCSSLFNRWHNWTILSKYGAGMTRRPCHYRRRSKKKHRNNTISLSSTGTQNDNDVTRFSVYGFFLCNLLLLLPIWIIPELSLSSFLVFYAQFNHAPSSTLAAIMIDLPFSLVVTSSVLFLSTPVFVYLLYIFQLMATHPPLVGRRMSAWPMQ